MSFWVAVAVGIVGTWLGQCLIGLIWGAMDWPLDDDKSKDDS